jgi:hypothetical protein
MTDFINNKYKDYRVKVSIVSGSIQINKKWLLKYYINIEYYYASPDKFWRCSIFIDIL